jgi:hypothetical protein
MAHIYDTGERAAVADERTTLETFLDHYRAVLVAKVRGVSDAGARRRLVPSATTLAGLLKHLQRVEASWFLHRLDQQPAEAVPQLAWLADDDRDGDFRLGPDDTVAALVAGYEAQCERSRETAARYDLDQVVPHPRLGAVSLRWIYVHMIDETARHAGHADILRELLDGSTGD